MVIDTLSPRRPSSFLIILLLAAALGTASAQGTTSRVVGVVTDTTGAVVPGATVTLTNEATRVSFNTVTTRTGTYAFDAVQVGTYFNAEERAKFNTPGAGQFSNVGRNFFYGPGSFTLNLAVLKDFRTVKGQRLEYRLEATNVTNTPSFGFPTTTLTSTTFGRIRDSVVSGARQIQMALKYYF